MVIDRLIIEADFKQQEMIKDAIIRFCGEQDIDFHKVSISKEERILELKKELEEYANAGG